MGAYLVQAAVFCYGAVTTDVIVVTHVDEASCEVVTFQLLGRVGTVLTCCRAMYDEILHGVGIEGDAGLYVC